MLVGIPKEIKNHEYRVGMTPAGVRELISHGHEVLVEVSAGDAIGFTDAMYVKAGADLVKTAQEIFSRADLVIKVKEPQPQECKLLREGQTLFTFLHLAPDPVQAELLMQSQATCIAYETVSDKSGGLPLLAPMSEVAGRIAIQAGASCMEKPQGGNGILMGGVPGVEPANVVVIGGGMVGLNAARMALGLGASVTILDRSLSRLKHIDEAFDGRIKTLYSTSESIEQQIQIADLIIGAVLIPGAAAPKLITREMLTLMKPGTVLVDVAIDQGGCFETSHPTTHEEPTYIVDGITHYCVANMPGAVARTATLSLTNATLPYILKLADLGPQQALLGSKEFLAGLNVHRGSITCEAVAEVLGKRYVNPSEALQ